MIKRLLNQLSVLIGILFLVGIYRYLNQTMEIHLSDAIHKIGFIPILLASVFYFSSHLLRGLRIAVMIAREDLSLRSIVRTQFYTNGINLVLPFKLGEVYRLYEFHKLIKKYQISISTIVAEKFIDFSFLLLGLIITFNAVGSETIDLNYTLVLSSIAVFTMTFICLILPQNIESFNLFIAKRYSFPILLKVLSFTSKLNLVIRTIRSLFKEKTAALFLFTVLIWTLEILSFICLFHFMNDIKLIILLSLLVFLSVFIPSGSLGLGGIQLAFYCIYLIRNDFQFLEFSIIYQMFLFLPAILISFVLLLAKKHKEYKQLDKFIYKETFYQMLLLTIRKKLNKVLLTFNTRISNIFKYLRVRTNW